MESLEKLLRDFKSSKEQMDALMQKVPRIIGVESVRIVRENFILQGYDSGAGVKKWDKRKPATNKEYDTNRGKGGTSNFKGSVYSSSKPILDQSGNLKNSIRYVASAGMVFVGVNMDIVPYAKIHNEGGSISMPERTAINHFGENKKFSTVSKASYASKNKVAAHTITMPKRQYMPLPGQQGNPKIIRVVGKKIEFEIKKAMKSFAQ